MPLTGGGVMRIAAVVKPPLENGALTTNRA